MAVLSHPRRAGLLAALIAAVCALAGVPAVAHARFDVGLQDPGFQQAPTTPASQFDYKALQATHGNTVRLSVGWASIAPGGSSEPSGFNASNPGDSHYNWTAVDGAIKQASAHHYRILADLVSAPAWAQAPNKPASLKIFGGYWNPSARDFRLFAQAAARRYSGHFIPAGQTSPLPRVRYWEIWNEENLPEDLTAPKLIPEFRSLLAAGYSAVKGVSKSNVVVMGGLAPVSFINGISVSPLKFAAEVLCLQRHGARFVRAPQCSARPRFDILGMHPYSLAATPTKHAYRYDDILVGDMGKLDALLSAARRLNHLKAGLWVDEWSWFTNPPDRQIGDAPMTAARYTAYSMYEMWKAGASVVIWFSVIDPAKPPANSPSFVNGGGLYSSNGKPKLMMRAFTFPVIAGTSASHGFVWGRAPVSQRAMVAVEHRVGGQWRRLFSVRTGRDGIFEARLPTSAKAAYRARLASGLVSLSYNSATIPDRRTH